MNVGELKNELDMLDDDLEIRFAAQPSWPLAYELDSTVAVVSDCEIEEIDDEDDEGNDIQYLGCITHECKAGECDATEYVWLFEGYQLGYVPGSVTAEVGWR